MVLVDDQSRDGTAEVARDAAAALGAAERLTVLSGRRCRPAGPASSGRSSRASTLPRPCRSPPDYLLFTDADIVYAPDVLTGLVARAQAGGSVLTSLMVKLRCESFAERLFIPAFIFFFQMLYPFAWANDPRRATAARPAAACWCAATCCAQAGGMAAIRDALIDDCALGKNLKAHGPIWIGLTERVRSIRAYPAVADIRRMVSRTAYAQLRYSPLLLAGRLSGMALTYLAPVALTLFADGLAQYLGPCRLAADGVGVPADVAVLSRVAAVGAGVAGHRGHLYGVHARFRLSACARARRHVEGPRPRQCSESNDFGTAMNDASDRRDDWRSGKGHRDENFPVASLLIPPRHRAPILAFYNFVRTADDIADHATLPADEKLELLDRLGAGLVGKTTARLSRCGCAPSSPRAICRRGTRRTCSPRSGST